jgi:hypothetical protein
MNFRNQYSDLFANPSSWNWQVSTSDWNNGRRIYLTNGSMNVIILGNFTGTGSIITYPNFPKTGTWYELLTGNQLNVTNTTIPVTLSQSELRIYTDQKVTLPNGISAPKYDSDCTIYPSVTNQFVTVSSTSAVNSVKVYNLQGSLLQSFNNKTEIDISNLSNGLYLLEVNTLQGRSIHKIVKE